MANLAIIASNDQPIRVAVSRDSLIVNSAGFRPSEQKPEQPPTGEICTLTAERTQANGNPMITADPMTFENLTAESNDFATWTLRRN